MKIGLVGLGRMGAAAERQKLVAGGRQIGRLVELLVVTVQYLIGPDNQRRPGSAGNPERLQLGQRDRDITRWRAGGPERVLDLRFVDRGRLHAKFDPRRAQ